MVNKGSEDASTLDPIFRPRSIAVIGASRKKGSIGRNILHNLIEFEFNGPVFPINPQANVIHSIKCYPSLQDVPDEVDLAIIVVPKSLANKAVEDCGKKGVKGIIMITAGFKEVGGDGLEREREIGKILKKYQMRMVGPNCMGVINTHPDFNLDATFAPSFPAVGNIGFLSQSGALGAAILEHANELNLGISQFVSVGNKLDISGNDIVHYWAQDEQTKVILLYLESFGNPRVFTQLAREIVKKKPIICVKSGRTRAGAKAASSHTGALAGMDVGTHALFEQCGVLRVNTVEELFDLAQAFSRQPIPKGKRVAILTNAGGPGIMATDATVSVGLEMAKFSKDTVSKLREFLSTEASFSNPLDMIASANEEGYFKSLKILLADEGVDAAIVIFVHPVYIDAIGIASSIIKASKTQKKKPVLCVFMGRKNEASGIEELQKAGLPTYLYPESAAIAIAAMEKYHKIKTRKKGKVVTFKDVSPETAEKIFKKVQRDGREMLTDLEVNRVLAAYNIPMPPFTLVKSLEDAVRFTEQKNYPVVLKVISPDVVHKSDVGGVIVDLRDEAELVRGYMKLRENLAKLDPPLEDYEILIQEMVKGGKELILGMTYDPSFGPLIMCGLGGIYVEILKDVNFRIHPITDLDAKEMLENLKGIKLLKGVRGEKGVDLKAVMETLQRLSQLIGDFPVIKEMDMNPFMAFADRKKCMALDARMSIQPAEIEELTGKGTS
ncbi:acyl-CoA synthetase [candidate division LCP-89 bacterium B3_LCP]|uniref:Acyl-CoA synthetase n=1 Tax=candidate division LCP-89 bacterium B3_LCP TaxID=2012998 RepID=A0A532V2R9_UNCL8|nr:MAG: acyl-CoA synthetase [candidate division LCP-89 bacterium B3_LCP]